MPVRTRKGDRGPKRRTFKINKEMIARDVREMESFGKRGRELEKLQIIPEHSHRGMQQTEYCPICKRYLKREDLP